MTALWFWESSVSLFVVDDYRRWRFEPTESGHVRPILPFDGHIALRLPEHSRVYFDALTRKILRIEEYRWWNRTWVCTTNQKET